MSESGTDSASSLFDQYASEVLGNANVTMYLIEIMGQIRFEFNLELDKFEDFHDIDLSMKDFSEWFNGSPN